MKDLTVILEDRPGELADLGEATGNAGITSRASAAPPRRARAPSILVEDEAATRTALGEGGIEVGGRRDVLVVDVEDRPGSMRQVARRIGQAGVNIELVYTTFGAVRLVLGVDDIDKARAACDRDRIRGALLALRSASARRALEAAAPAGSSNRPRGCGEHWASAPTATAIALALAESIAARGLLDIAGRRRVAGPSRSTAADGVRRLPAWAAAPWRGSRHARAGIGLVAWPEEHRHRAVEQSGDRRDGGRTAIVAWRASELDSEGNGIQSGLLHARLRAPDGTLSASQRLFTTPARTYRLATAPSDEALLAWVPSEVSEPAGPGALDLRYVTRPGGGRSAPRRSLAASSPPATSTALPPRWATGRSSRPTTRPTASACVARPPDGTFDPGPELDAPGLYPLVAAAGTRASPPGSSPRATRCGSWLQRALGERELRMPGPALGPEMTAGAARRTRRCDCTAKDGKPEGMARLENYSFGRLTVDGQERARDLIVLPDRVVSDWWRREGHSLAIRTRRRGARRASCAARGGRRRPRRLRPDPAVIAGAEAAWVQVDASTDAAVRRYGELRQARHRGGAAPDLLSTHGPLSPRASMSSVRRRRWTCVAKK